MSLRDPFPGVFADLESLSQPPALAHPTSIMKKTIFLYSEGGTSLVVHAKADDMKTDPAGNAGDRIACGLIVK
jgi:Cu/Zn superoxide dismutase